MNERDELAELIASVTIDTLSGDVLRVHPDGETPVFEGDQRTADAILAAGYRKPRQATTTEELDALPVGSVVLCSGRAFQREHKAGGRNALDWSAHSMAFGVTNEWLLAHMPLTVLHVGAA